MRVSLVVFVAMILCLIQSGAFAAPKGSKWRIGEPIVWYWAGPGSHNEVNDTTVSQLVAGGWTMAWDTGWPKTEEPKYLDLYHRHGMRVMLNLGRFVEEWEAKPGFDFNDQEQTRELDELIDRLRNHPALYAYYLWDEPNASRFSFLGRFVAHLRKLDPTRPTIINLYPVEASTGLDGQLGTEGDMVTAYREHLRQFAEKVKPDALSYDYYPFMKRGDMSTYFLNLMMVREAALKAGIPFINVTQAIAHEDMGYRWPTEHEMRWLAYTTLAYGGQGICWYIYNCRNCGISGFFKDCPESTVPKPQYWAVSRTNRDFVAIATQLQPLKSLAAYHVGPHEKAGSPADDRWKKVGSYQTGPLPLGGVTSPENSPFQVESPSGSPNILLGCFGKSGRPASHVLVVNLDYKNPVTTTLKGPGAMDIFHAPTRKWTRSATGSRAKLEMPPGGGVLIRLK